MEIEIFQNEFGGSFRSTGQLIWIQHAILGSKWGTCQERLHLKQTWVVTKKGRQTLLWNIQPRLTALPVWDRNNWHGSLWRPTYVWRRGEVRRSYKNKSLKRRHKRKVKKLEGKKQHAVDEKERVTMRQWWGAWKKCVWFVLREHARKGHSSKVGCKQH